MASTVDGSLSSTVSSLGSFPVAVATLVKSAVTGTVQVYVSVAPAAMLVKLLSQSVANGSLTSTPVSSTSPQLFTVMVNVASSPTRTCWLSAPSAFLLISMQGVATNVLVKVQVTVSPGPTSIADGSLPSSQVALVL